MTEKNAAEIKQAYLQKKNQVLSLLDQTKQFYEEEHMNDRANVFSELHRKLEEGGFSIVVVGEFSTGKSTLLNALMGKKLLPSFTNETTATVNFLRHKDQAPNGEAGIVYYNDGHTVSLPDDDLQTVEKYVSTKGDDVAANVQHLDLFMDSDFLKDGVMLVDSPGLNGIAEGHREITEDQIAKSHASIFLFSSDHPGSKTDFEMLNDLLQRVNTIFFVLNKIDVIKESEGESVEDVVKKLKENYHAKFPNTRIPEILPVSAYNALKARDPILSSGLDDTQRKNLEESSRFSAFESRLLRFLTCGEKTKQELTAPVTHVIDIVRNSRDGYEEEKNVLETLNDGTEIQGKINSLQDEMNHIKKERTISSSHVKQLVNQGFRETRNELSANIDKYTKTKINDIDGLESLDKLNDYVQSFERIYLRKVQGFLRDADQSLRQNIEDIINQEFVQAAESIENKMIGKEMGAVKLSIKNHLDTSERSCDDNTDFMEAREKELKNQLQDLRKETNSLKASSSNYDILAQEEMTLKNRISDLTASKERMQQYQLPAVTGRLEHRLDKRPRKGLLGRLANGIIGDKIIQKEVWVEDEASIKAREEAKAFRANALKSYSSQTESAESELKRVSEEKKKVMEAQAEYDAKSEEMNQLRQDLIELQKNHAELLDKEMKKELRKSRNVLREYCYGIQDEVEDQVKKMLRDVCDAYVTNIVEVVDWNLQDALQEKIRQQKNLQEQLNSSIEEKNNKIDILTKKIDQLNQLMQDAVSLQEDLDAIKVDVIQEG